MKVLFFAPGKIKHSLKVPWQIVSLFPIYRMNEDTVKYLALICCKIWDNASWCLNWCPTEERGSCQHARMNRAGESKPTPYSSVLCLWLLLPEHQKPWWHRKQDSGKHCPEKEQGVKRGAADRADRSDRQCIGQMEPWLCNIKEHTTKSSQNICRGSKERATASNLS